MMGSCWRLPRRRPDRSSGRFRQEAVGLDVGLAAKAKADIVIIVTLALSLVTCGLVLAP